MLNKKQFKKSSNNSTIYKSDIFLSSQNINGSPKSSHTSTDDTSNSIDYGKINDSQKAKSTSNIFEKTDDADYNAHFYRDNFKSSLKLCVESMVFGQRLQMTCELLLLSSSIELWPLSLHHLNRVQRDFNKFTDCHDELLSSITTLKQELNRFENCIVGGASLSVSPDEKIGYINDIVTTAITIMELTYQSVYTISSTQPSWKRNQPGVLDRKTIISAIDNVELSCFRLREILLRVSNCDFFSFTNQELQEVLLFSCSNFSSALTYLAICCRTAAANVDISIKSSQKSSKKNPDTRPEENLFQLAMSSVSKSSQCMLASVKNYVNEPNIENRFIMESFTNTVSSSVKALAAMATSSKFVGYPSLLPVSIKMMRNTICGSCMSLISPIIQLLQTTAAIYSLNNSQPLIFDQVLGQTDQTISHLLQRAITCIAAIRAAMSHLQQTLNLYQNY